MKNSFEDLDVWKKSCRLSVRLYRLLKDCRDYGLRDQMQRAAVSIPSNIAEGSERRSATDFRRFVRFAQGSAAELRTQVYISREIGAIAKPDATELIQELRSISKMLQALHGSIGDPVPGTGNRKPETGN